MAIPRILVIDDIFGSSLRDRKNFCKNFGLLDVTGDEPKPAAINDPISEAVFESSQATQNHSVKNLLSKTLAAVERGWSDLTTTRWALVLLDLRFVSGQLDDNNEAEGHPEDDLFGLKLLDAIRGNHPDLPVIIISSQERSEVIEDCRRRGAADFIQRHQSGTTSLSARDLLKSKILEHGLIGDTRILADENLRIVGNSVGLLKALRAARRAATGKGNILLLGETGTGKELLARYLHDMSPKASGPYEVFDPSGRAETLQEDELFGHVKGAFTGADSDKPGMIELADGGTLFIDEIGEIPESLQTKLLRPLESWIVKRQGGKKEVAVDLQVVLATNKNLDLYVAEKRFKFDLLNRIKAYPIIIPPLSERKEDIPRLTEKLLELICRQHNARWPRTVLPETIILLQNNDWRDNIRGLRNVLQRAILNNKDSELVVPQDIVFDLYESEIRQETKEVSVPPDEDQIKVLMETMACFEFPPDYEILHGKLPLLQEAIASLLTRYLQAAVEVTKRRKPGSLSSGETNLTGAVSCMEGAQLKTAKAADLIKKILHQDKKLLQRLPEEFPELDQIYNEAIRLRPTQQRKS